MRTLVTNALRPLVHMVHEVLVTAVALSGLTCGLLLPFFVTLWIYDFNTGPHRPDATHVYRISDYSNYIYLTHGQRAVLDVIEIMLLSSLGILAPSIAANAAFERVFSPRTWGYEPLSASKRTT